MHRVQNFAEAESGRLLRVLLLWGRPMPADSGSADERQSDKLLRTGWPRRLTGDVRLIGRELPQDSGPKT
jgi:hypothetical protein